MSREKSKFIDWLNCHLKEDYKNDKFYRAAWTRAQEADVNGSSFELEAFFTLAKRPFSYRLS